MRLFYRFCHLIDEIADDPSRPAEERREKLLKWRDGLQHGFHQPDAFQTEIASMFRRCEVNLKFPLQLIDGCLADCLPQNLRTLQELISYMDHVATSVGMVSIHLMGCRSAMAGIYAVALARALQMTNILRDVGEDIMNGGRIYLPTELREHFGYRDQDFENRIHDDRFRSMMNHFANLADSWFREADDYFPQQDRMALRPARVMHAVYAELLKRMRSDDFQVYAQRYRVPTSCKFWLLLRHIIG